MQTVCQHQKGGHWTSTSKEQKNKKKIEKIYKYTYTRGEFTAQTNIHDGPFLQK